MSKPWGNCLIMIWCIKLSPSQPSCWLGTLDDWGRSRQLGIDGYHPHRKFALRIVKPDFLVTERLDDCSLLWLCHYFNGCDGINGSCILCLTFYLLPWQRSSYVWLWWLPCFDLLGTNTSNPFWNAVRDVLKTPTEEQVNCHAPKPILLDTGEVNICVTEFAYISCENFTQNTF